MRMKGNKRKRSRIPVEFEGEEEEENVSPSINNILPKGRIEVPILDLIVSCESKTKRTKNKRKRRESSFSSEEELKKSKLIYIPKSNYPFPSEGLNNNLINFDEETLVEDINIAEISLNCLDIPLNSGWKVVYSLTEPTICEVWKEKTSLMFMLTSETTAQVQVSFQDCTGLDKHGETIASICEKIDKEPTNSKTRCPLVFYNEDAKIDFYHPNVALRYLTVGGTPQESDSLDLSRMVMADWVHLGTECDICLCECQPLEMGCGHSYCTPCWRRWLASPRGRSAQCPHPGCLTILDIVTHHWLAGPRLFQETRAEMLASRLASDPSLLQCRARCRRVARRRDLSVTRVTCVCGTGTCVRCGQEDHWPATCAELAKYTKFTAVYSDLKKLEEEVEVRGCPQCGLLWEKMWGCNHMVCSSCHASFCWGCGQDQSHHSGSGGWCGHITAPLETRTITPVPTEMALMKQIELFIIAKTIRNQTREFVQKKKSKALSLWTESAIDTYNYSKQVLKYGLLCDRILKSKQLMSKLQCGLASMSHLRLLLKETKQNDHWKSLVKLHVHNVNLATKSICKRF